MENTHLEHPEDSVLLGKKAVQDTINYLRNCKGDCSVKYDGAPAIVFGTHPVTNQFFVGTKSVFNKKKVKVNYTHADIEKNHGNNSKVAGILHTCLEVLPKLEGVYQGDFIGFGGTNRFTTNTITYTFDTDSDSFRNCSVVFAAHTRYSGDTSCVEGSENPLNKLSASFDIPEYLKHNFMCTYFVNTDAQFTSRRRRVDYILGLASVVSNFVKYPTDKKEIERLKIAINKCIKENRPVDAISGNMLLLFDLITRAKEMIMEGLASCEIVDTIIDLGVDIEPVNHEGFVASNKFGTFKLVKRQKFSFYNFTLAKKW